MNVIFCTYDSPSFLGGPNSWLRRLLPELKCFGIKVKVIFFIDAASPDECPTYQAICTQGIECLSYPWQTTTEQKIHWLLSRLAEDSPDIFVPHMIVSAFYASQWLKKAGIPTVGVLHSDDEFYRGVLRQFVFGRLSYQLSAIVSVSEFLKQNISDIQKTTTSIQYIPCGVPLPQKLAQPPLNKLRLIYVGRLEEEQKRISEVTFALCRTVRELPNTEAVIFGEGSARANVEEILAKEGGRLPVQLAGSIDNAQIQEVMLEHHIIVLLSDYEGLPISLMEAMACGLVPICLQIRSGIPELVEDGVTGLLVSDRGDSFIAAVKRIQYEPDLWSQLSAAARTRIAASYCDKVCTVKWLDLLNKLHQNAGAKESICHPYWLKLPPVDAGLASEDIRQFHLLSSSIYKKLRQTLSPVKRKILSTIRDKLT